MPASVFTIPASAPFLRTLIDALVAGRLVKGFPGAGDPLALASATLYLPTRRACRQARLIFLEALKTDAAILPRIIPIGDVDEDEIAFAEFANAGAATLDLPEALGGFERNALLAELILKWATQPGMRTGEDVSLVAQTPAAALALASDLARLMDDMTTRQVPWDALDTLVPDALDVYWQKTMAFLNIVARQQWPAHLNEQGKIEPADRRDRLIEAESARLANTRAPVIAAGSTGSMPATAKLLATIAKLPHGAVVLPGLDIDLDKASWEQIAGDGEKDEPSHGHPQYAMHALLKRIGILRETVTVLAEPAPHGRERLLSEALRPAATTERWQQGLAAPDFSTHADTALEGIAVVEAANAEEEALAIAVALREAVETPGKTAALVTPDRALARRVLAALARWNIAADDSGGDRLADTEAGVFARLAAEAALKGLEPVTLLALLKHPICRFERRAVAALERAILRGNRPREGVEGLEQALAAFRGELAKFRRREATSLHRSDPRTELTDAELDAAAALVATLRSAFAPLEAIKAKPLPVAAIARLHRDVVRTLGGETEELAKAFDEIEAYGRLTIAPAHYGEFFHAAIAEHVVRLREEQDVRVRIFGSLEARLQNVDRMVLGGMVEGVWPPQTRADPWLNRPMRHRLKLDLPERRIGLSAHDFAQALGAHEVILTRAAKLAGAPTVASRFVQRLAAVAGDERWKVALERGAHYVTLARALDQPAQRARPVARPEPRPPRDARPSSLTVTEIETWLRDPYSIYARRILRLQPLDAVDTPPGARDRGTVIHNAIGAFAETYKAGLPDDAVGELLKLGKQHFSTLAEFPDAQAFWWPRFERIAGWFAATFEPERRANIRKLDVEVAGGVEIAVGDRTFTLRARADRIEHLADGRYAILDYKTGQVPTPPQVKSGLSPQLTLEGAILRAGRFGDIPPGASIAEFIYISIRGGEPPGESKPVVWKDSTPDLEADMALKRLSAVIAKFEDPDTPYRSRERPMFMRRGGGDYDHLSRVREWSLSGGAEDAEGSAE